MIRKFSSSEIQNLEMNFLSWVNWDDLIVSSRFIWDLSKFLDILSSDNYRVREPEFLTEENFCLCNSTIFADVLKLVAHE